MDRTDEVRVPDNNNAVFSLLSFNVKIGIDYLTLSVSINSLVPVKFISPDSIKHEQFFHDFLISNGYRRRKHTKLQDNNNHKFNDQYFRSSDHNNIELIYMPKARFIPYMMIKIHDPSLEIVNMFDSLLTENWIHVKLSYLELRFDFYADSRVKIREFLKHHLFFRYQRSLSSRYKTTYYTNDIRKDFRGMRIYDKKNLDCARMELCLGRKSLASNKIEFPLHNINDLDLDRFFKFMDVDIDKFHNNLLWADREQINQLTQKSPMSADLLKQTIRSWLDSKLSDDDGDKGYLMTTVEELKLKSDIPNYSRFLVPMDDFSAEFKRQISSQKFLC